MPNDIEMVRGLAVATNQNTTSSVRGYAVATQQAQVADFDGVIIKAPPNTLQHVTGFNVFRRVGSHLPYILGIGVISVLYPPYVDLSLRYTFSENRFPDHISYGSSGGPGFRTSIFTVDSGVATAQAEWDRMRARYTVEFDFATGADIDEIEDFFYGMRGQAIGFRFKDWSDYQINKQVMAVGDGTTRSFQIFKRYESGGFHFDRIIKKPIRESIRGLTLDGEEQLLRHHYNINNTTGELIFDVAPPPGAIVEIEYLEFDVPVRFATDQLSVEAVEHDQYRASIDLIEVMI